MVFTNLARRNNVRTIGAVCAAVVLDCTIVCALDSQDTAETLAGTRVRSTDARMLELIREGRARSTTFNGLVEAIDHSAGITYVEFGFCAFGHLNGCLLPFIARAHGDRYLR